MNEVRENKAETDERELSSELRIQSMLFANAAKRLRREEFLLSNSLRGLCKRFEDLEKRDSNEAEKAKARIKRRLEDSRRRSSSLYKMRVNSIRPQARGVHLIRGFLSGKNYRVVEEKVRKFKMETEPVDKLLKDISSQLGFSKEKIDQLLDWSRA